MHNENFTFAILLCGEIVRVPITSVEGVGLTGPRRGVVIPASDGRSADGSTLTTQ